MRSIEKENKKLKDILPKNFAHPELDKRRLGDVVDLFTNLQMVENESSKDILGNAYQYCLRKFAEQEGKPAGEFFTPEYVVKTLVEVLQPFNGRVYDPCCGSGGMFVQSVRFIENHSGNINRISVYGQGSNPTTWKLAQMNLAIRGIDADPILLSLDGDRERHNVLRGDIYSANASAISVPTARRFIPKRPATAISTRSSGRFTWWGARLTPGKQSPACISAAERPPSPPAAWRRSSGRWRSISASPTASAWNSTRTGYSRDSIWTFSHGEHARYSSMTRDNFLGFGCSATTLLRDQFKTNTFSIEEYCLRIDRGLFPTSLTLRFSLCQRMVYYLFWTAYSTQVSAAIDKM